MITYYIKEFEIHYNSHNMNIFNLKSYYTTGVLSGLTQLLATESYLNMMKNTFFLP